MIGITYVPEFGGSEGRWEDQWECCIKVNNHHGEECKKDKRYLNTVYIFGPNQDWTKIVGPEGYKITRAMESQGQIIIVVFESIIMIPFRGL